MFNIKCPKCGGKIGLDKMDVILFRILRRRCKHCGQELKLGWAFFFVMFLAVIFGAVLILLTLLSQENIAIKTGFAFTMLWVCVPVIVHSFGKWQLSERRPVSREARKWEVLEILFWIVFYGAGIIAGSIFLLQYKEIVGTAVEDGMVDSEAVRGLYKKILPSIIVAISALIGALILRSIKKITSVRGLRG